MKTFLQSKLLICQTKRILTVNLYKRQHNPDVQASNLKQIKLFFEIQRVRLDYRTMHLLKPLLLVVFVDNLLSKIQYNSFRPERAY